MTLDELLEETRDPYTVLTHTINSQPVDVIQVFPRCGYVKYYNLRDYVVSSAVSGPSLVLVPIDEESSDD